MFCFSQIGIVRAVQWWMQRAAFCARCVKDLVWPHVLQPHHHISLPIRPDHQLQFWACLVILTARSVHFVCVCVNLEDILFREVQQEKKDQADDCQLSVWFFFLHSSYEAEFLYVSAFKWCKCHSVNPGLHIVFWFSSGWSWLFFASTIDKSILVPASLFLL